MLDVTLWQIERRCITKMSKFDTRKHKTLSDLKAMSQTIPQEHFAHVKLKSVKISPYSHTVLSCIIKISNFYSDNKNITILTELTTISDCVSNFDGIA